MLAGGLVIHRSELSLKSLQRDRILYSKKTIAPSNLEPRPMMTVVRKNAFQTMYPQILAAMKRLMPEPFLEQFIEESAATMSWMIVKR